MAADFRSIRSWDGSQDRAFEEICYQLLREPQDLPPDLAGRPIRTGNPDGGVEWYALRTNGEQWGWQAKYIEDIDDLLSAMTKTVKRVAAERPTLTKLTFCIPRNLPAGTAKGKRKSARKKYEDKVAAWQKDTVGADKIEFELKQSSDLLDRLSLPQHTRRSLAVQMPWSRQRIRPRRLRPLWKTSRPRMAAPRSRNALVAMFASSAKPREHCMAFAIFSTAQRLRRSGSDAAAQIMGKSTAGVS